MFYCLKLEIGECIDYVFLYYKKLFPLKCQVLSKTSEGSDNSLDNDTLSENNNIDSNPEPSNLKRSTYSSRNIQELSLK